jgi:hypothetical protein
MSSPALPDGTISSDVTGRRSAALARRVGWVAEGAGGRFGEVELSAVVTLHQGADPHAVARRVAAERGWDPDGAEGVLDMPAMLLGPLAHILEQAQTLRDRFGITYLVVSDRDLEAFAPVVQRLTG